MDKGKYIIGALVLLVLSSVIYITYSDQVRIRVDNDKTTFYVPHEEYSWLWVVSGREYNSLFDGSSKMNRRTSSIKVWSEQDGNNVWIYRNTTYIRGPVIKDTYHFRGDIEDVELFPISHKIEVFNGKGYFYRYEARDLIYDGEKYKLGGENELDFGRNMKLELQKGYRWAWVYSSGIVKAQYDLPSDYEVFYIRLFDPIEDSPCYQESANVSNQTGSDGVCGLNYTGNYEEFSDSAKGLVYVNYTKPQYATNESNWTIKHGTLSAKNITIPNSCWDHSSTKLLFRLYSSHPSAGGTGYSYGQCFNGSWINITDIESGSEGFTYISNATRYLAVYDGDWDSSGIYLYGADTWAQATQQPRAAELYEEAMWWVVEACNPELNQNWTIADKIICDNVEVTTGSGIIIINNGNLTLINSANITTSGLTINKDGEVIFINAGSNIII